MKQDIERVKLATEADYFFSYLDIIWQINAKAGLRTWVDAFEQALDNWQETKCQRLLREIKRAPSTLELEEVVYYSEGCLAERQGDFNHAIRCYLLSLTSARDASQNHREAEILTALGEVYHEVGQFADAIKHLQQALDIFRTIEASEDYVAGVLSQLGAAYTRLGNWEKAQDCFEEGLSLSSTTEQRAVLLTNSGSWYQEQGELDLAIQQYIAALNIYEAIGAQNEQTILLNNLGIAALTRNQIQEAHEYFLNAFALLQSRGNWTDTIQTLGNYALSAYRIGDLQTAIQYCVEAIDSARSIGDMQALGVFLNLRGILRIDLNEWKIAIPDLIESLDLARQTGDRSAEVATLNNLGTGYRHLEQFDEAQTCYETASVLAKELGQYDRLGEINGNLGHLYTKMGDREQARACYEHSVAYAERMGDNMTACSSLIDLCSISFEENDPVQLKILLDRAYELGNSVAQPDLSTRIKWLQGDLAMLEGNHSGIFTAYGEAAIFAAQFSDDLVNATFERIEMHLNYLEPEAIVTANQALQKAWSNTSIGDIGARYAVFQIAANAHS